MTAGAAVLSAVLLVRTLRPIYNIVKVSFEAEGDVFSDHLWPPKAPQRLLPGGRTQSPIGWS